MFGFGSKSVFHGRKVRKASDDAAYRNFGHAAASISKAVKASIIRQRGPSLPGQPPATRKGLLRRAVRFFADKQGAVIGPMKTIAGTVGAAHEFGGAYKGEDFDQRPFMYPALEQAAPRFAGSWRGSIGE